MNSIIKRNNDLSFFDDFFDGFFSKPLISGSTPLMKTDIKEVSNGYELELDVPGFGKDDIKISLEKGYLTVEVKKEENKENKDVRYLRQERVYSSCARSFYVGENIAEADIKAGYDKGVLTLYVPKQGTNVKEKKYIAIE
jgi:HSP20 family molecular chaperone IbpA